MKVEVNDARRLVDLDISLPKSEGSPLCFESADAIFRAVRTQYRKEDIGDVVYQNCDSATVDTLNDNPAILDKILKAWENLLDNTQLYWDIYFSTLQDAVDEVLK